MEALKALKTLEADVTIPLGSTDDEFEDDSTAELMLFWTKRGAGYHRGRKGRGGKVTDPFRPYRSISVP